MVMGELTRETDILVIGGGPGGYAAAFRAADLGREVILVDADGRAGGVCLFRGCIPSKTYLHLTELLHDAREAGRMGVNFDPPRIDLEAIRSWKDEVVGSLANGLATLAKRRNVEILPARAEFDSPHSVLLTGEVDVRRVRFKSAIIATGSRPVEFPGVSGHRGGRVMNSTGALGLADIPERLLVLGGGYVGLELGMVYAGLGSVVTLAELGNRLLPGVDADLVVPLAKRLETTFADVLLNTRILELREDADGVTASLKRGNGGAELRVDRVLVAIGRRPNTAGLEASGVALDDRGFVRVDDRQRTSVPHLFAVGDVTGGMMLAHKASREGKVAAEVICGEPSAFDAVTIPAVVYTDPQIAYCGLTEEAAQERGIPVETRRFPWRYSGRALTMGATGGLTKMLVEPASGRILGMGIVGRHAESLIGEAVLALEMGALAEDVALSIHPHPTLSETEAEVAEIFLGSATHVIR